MSWTRCSWTESARSGCGSSVWSLARNVVVMASPIRSDSPGLGTCHWGLSRQLCVMPSTRVWSRR